MHATSLISLFIRSAVLIISWLCHSSSSAQSGLTAPIHYHARDSIVADINGEVVKMYGKAHVRYEGVELTADYIEIDIKKGEVVATYGVDSSGHPTGKPFFDYEGDTSRCDYIRYNFTTRKAFIREVRAQQDEGYIHMSSSKRTSNEQIHLRHGKFTTCNLDTPHYHFRMTKAIIVPEKRIVTGPAYMKIFNIPVPLATPFGFFPRSKSKKQGFIAPSIARNANYGFGLQDIGYYIPLGDHWETSLLATVYITGRWGLENRTNYYKRYKSKGSFNIRAEQFRGYFYDTTLKTKVSLNWRHTQDPKAHPSLTFSSNVNFVSDNNGKSSLAVNNADYFTNQFNSSLSLSKVWKTRQFRGSASLRTALQQNSINQQYIVELPSFNWSVSRFNLGVLRKQKIGKKWYEEINVQYRLKGNNRIDAPDSIFRLNAIDQLGDYTLNGVTHGVEVNSQLKLLGSRVNFTPKVTYDEIWNFQYERHFWNPSNQSIDTTALRGFKSGRGMNFSGTLTGSFYGLYRLKGKRKTRFKHVAAANVGVNYRPDMSAHQAIQSDALGNSTYISPFTSSLYRGQNRGSSARISFSLNNTLRMKTRSKKDTINDSDLSFNLIDLASVGGNYDFLKDSMRLSDLSLQLRTAQFLRRFTFQIASTLSPYAYDELGNTFGTYAWNSGQGIGRMTRVNMTLDARLAGNRKKKSALGGKAEGGNQTAAGTNAADEAFTWQLNTAYNLDINSVKKKTVTDDDYAIVQTARLDGDVAIRKKWKLSCGINLDLQQLFKKYQSNPDYPYSGLVTRWNMDISRDLHCWETVLQLGQLGLWNTTDWRLTNFTFLFRINIKASLLRDVKLEFNRPPFF